MEDQTAINLIKQGDLDGLESLVERYQARAVQAAYLVVFDRALAEDVAQAAFIKAAERIRQFDETRPFAPWFLRIVANDALKAARQGQRNLSLDDGPASRFDESLPAPGLLPEQLLEQAETRRDLLAAVHSLSPEQRAVITLHYFLDLSEADMSARLERPTSTIKWWLREARKHLRNLLDGSR